MLPCPSETPPDETSLAAHSIVQQLARHEFILLSGFAVSDAPRRCDSADRIRDELRREELDLALADRQGETGARIVALHALTSASVCAGELDAARNYARRELSLLGSRDTAAAVRLRLRLARIDRESGVVSSAAKWLASAEVLAKTYPDPLYLASVHFERARLAMLSRRAQAVRASAAAAAGASARFCCDMMDSSHRGHSMPLEHKFAAWGVEEALYVEMVAAACDGMFETVCTLGGGVWSLLERTFIERVTPFIDVVEYARSQLSSELYLQSFTRGRRMLSRDLMSFALGRSGRPVLGVKARHIARAYTTWVARPRAPFNSLAADLCYESKGLGAALDRIAAAIRNAMGVESGIRDAIGVDSPLRRPAIAVYVAVLGAEMTRCEVKSYCRENYGSDPASAEAVSVLPQTILGEIASSQLSFAQNNAISRHGT